MSPHVQLRPWTAAQSKEGQATRHCKGMRGLCQAGAVAKLMQLQMVPWANCSPAAAQPPQAQTGSVILPSRSPPEARHFLTAAVMELVAGPNLASTCSAGSSACLVPALASAPEAPAVRTALSWLLQVDNSKQKADV